MKRPLVTAALTLLAACAPAAPTAQPMAEPPTIAPATQPPTQGAVDISDERAAELMQTLGARDREAGAAALEEILAADDERFVSVLLELMRGTEVGMFLGLEYEQIIDGMQRLSGQSFGANWPAWVEWYGATDLAPPPGFLGWKGELLSWIDPGFGEFLAEDGASSIRVEEIQWGGVTVDGIPALDQAEMIPAAEAEYLLAEEPVFGVAINGDARAYPLRILDWHEMANDVVGGVPMSLAYCTLCGAAIAYDGRASDGVTYDFGSSGFLYRSNKLMYDRQTRSLWNQLTGEPVVGSLVGTGVRLDLLPVVLTSWEDWQEQHPDTQVLRLETGYERIYLPGAAYGHYFSSDDTMFPVWQRSEALGTKDRVYALRIDGVPKAYPLDALVEERVVNDTLAGTNLALVAGRGRVLVDGESRYVGAVTYEAGGEVRAYDRGGETFTPGPVPDSVLDSQGNEWQVTEEALIGPDGAIAPRVNGHLAYWFGWFSFFPNTEIYEDPSPGT